MSNKFKSAIKRFYSLSLALVITIALSGVAVLAPVSVSAEHTTAHTIEQLLAQIASLQASLEALQGGPSTTTSAQCNFTRSLTIGSNGSDVTCLQDYLTSTGHFTFSGGSTGYFGSATKAAVASWQASNNVSPAVGFFGPISQAKYNSVATTTTTTTTTPETPETPETPVTPISGTVSVSLASSSPSAQTVIADSTTADGAQALIEGLRLTFTGDNVKITSLKVKRGGISADADIANMYLKVDGNILDNIASVSSTYSTFNNAAGLFAVNGTKDVEVLFDLASGTTSGKTINFSVNSASDITVDSGTVSGSYPIMGNSIATATASDLGKVTIAHVSDPGTSIEAALTNQTLWTFSLASADQALTVNKIKVDVIGTINANDLGNLYIYDGVNQIGTAVASLDSDKTLTFSNLNYKITAGQTKNISVRGDVLSGTGRTFQMRVSEARDIEATDNNYNVNLRLNQSDTYTIITASSTTTISTGSLTINKSTSSTSGNVAKDALGVLLAKYDFKAVGEAVKISNLVVSAVVSGSNGTDIDNAKILLNGSQIGTTKDLESLTADDGNAADAADDDDTQFTFGNSFIAQSGVTNTVEIYGDIKKGAGTSYSGGETILIGFEAGTSNALRQTTGTTFNTTAVDGNTLTISSASLSTAKNASVANQNIVGGSQDVVIGSWMITAGAAEAINVSSIVVIEDGAQGIGSAFNNLELWSNGVKYAQTISNSSATDGTSNTFNLSTNLNVPAGNSVQVDLKGTVLGNPTWTDADEIKISSVTGIGATTSGTVSDTTGAVGQTLTTATAGTITAAVAATPTNPYATLYLAGKTENTVAAWKLSANNVEDLKVTRIQVQEVHSDNVPGNVKNLRLFVGGTQVGGTVPAMTTGSPDTALFEDNTNGLFTIPKNNDVIVSLKADITDASNATFGTNGKNLTFRIVMPTETGAQLTSSSEISARGALSNAFALEGVASDTNYDSNVVKVVKSKPTFAKYAGTPSGTLVVGTTEVARFTIAADIAGDITFTSGTHNIKFTVLAGEAGASTVSLLDASTDQAVATAISAATLIAGTELNFELFSDTGGLVIPAGTTRTFKVKANLAAFTATGDSFQLQLNNTAADLSFDDGNGTASTDINDAYTGKGLPIDFGVLTKPGA